MGGFTLGAATARVLWFKSSGEVASGTEQCGPLCWSEVKCQSHGDIYFNWCGEEDGFWPLHNLHYCKQNLLKLHVQGFSFCVNEVYLDSKSLTFSVQDYFRV